MGDGDALEGEKVGSLSLFFPFFFFSPRWRSGGGVVGGVLEHARTPNWK